MRDIKDFLLQELELWFKERGVAPYRSRQIFSWIYKKGIYDFANMGNIPQDLRHYLKDSFISESLRLRSHSFSKDGACKFAFETGEGSIIESVYIPHIRKRYTFCISSQVGCRFNCYFCASGKKGFVRSLSVAEILEQILKMRDFLKRAPSNIVFMGVGEPLDNYDSVLKSIEAINSPWGFNISQRRISLSTSGIVPRIRKLALKKMQIELSVSLHTLDNDLRNFLMPVNRIYPLEDLLKACKFYFENTNREITFEYILFKGLNDSPEDIRRIKKRIKGFLFKINLIPYNPIEGIDDLFPPSQEETANFAKKLRHSNIKVFIRKSRGADISGSCGQLRINIENKLRL